MSYYINLRESWIFYVLFPNMYCMFLHSVWVRNNLPCFWAACVVRIHNKDRNVKWSTFINKWKHRPFFQILIDAYATRPNSSSYSPSTLNKYKCSFTSILLRIPEEFNRHENWRSRQAMIVGIKILIFWNPNLLETISLLHLFLNIINYKSAKLVIFRLVFFVTERLSINWFDYTEQLFVRCIHQIACFFNFVLFLSSFILIFFEVFWLHVINTLRNITNVLLSVSLFLVWIHPAILLLRLHFNILTSDQNWNFFQFIFGRFDLCRRISCFLFILIEILGHL